MRYGGSAKTNRNAVARYNNTSRSRVQSTEAERTTVPPSSYPLHCQRSARLRGLSASRSVVRFCRTTESRPAGNSAQPNESQTNGSRIRLLLRAINRDCRLERSPGRGERQAGGTEDLDFIHPPLYDVTIVDPEALTPILQLPCSPHWNCAEIREQGISFSWATTRPCRPGWHRFRDRAQMIAPTAYFRCSPFPGRAMLRANRLSDGPTRGRSDR
jgi:hypothetical protein